MTEIEERKESLQLRAEDLEKLRYHDLLLIKKQLLARHTKSAQKKAQLMQSILQLQNVILAIEDEIGDEP